MRQSAGTLLYRQGPQGWEVLIVHPSGSYNRRAPWSIPKGEPGQEADLEQTARRETEEETGVVPGDLVYLGSTTYKKSRKQVHCYAGLAPANADPKPASWEVDQARFFLLEEAKQKLHPDQRVFIDLLARHLEGKKEGGKARG